jgi:hypothetical protein
MCATGVVVIRGEERFTLTAPVVMQVAPMLSRQAEGMMAAMLAGAIRGKPLDPDEELKTVSEALERLRLGLPEMPECDCDDCRAERGEDEEWD